ncbi:hypothetical protein [Kribbella sp. NPDC048915]|uniref:hypothetical protein n=1 Tax=Kribbella sp. NPDC048915 TaxID=3155148 RepID=UPI00340FAF05
MKYYLLHHPDFSRDMDRLHAEWTQDRDSRGGREFEAAIGAMKALREAREGEFEGKRLAYGPQSYDLRDCAELKVPVEREFTPRGGELGPSHRLVYREFDPLPKVEGHRVVPDPDARPYRQLLAFAHRSQAPADIAGERLGRERGLMDPELYGVGSGERPSVGPQREGMPTTPYRVPVPGDLLKQAQILRDSPPAGTAPKPAEAPQAMVNRSGPAGPDRAKGR